MLSTGQERPVGRRRKLSPAMSTELPLAPLEPGRSILGDEVYAVLGAAIRDGALAPGQRLRDVDVAEALGVSRTPVREALQRLERIGLVEVSANRYTRVSEHDDALLLEAHDYLVYAVGIGLRMSLANCSDDELASQVCWAEDMITASTADDHIALTRASAGLYELVSRSSGNRVFLRVMREAGLFFQRSVESWTPHMLDVTERTATFRELRDAIAARDGARAEAVVRRQHGVG